MAEITENDDLKKAVNAFSAPEGSILPEEIKETPIETPLVETPIVTFTPNPVWNVIKETLGVEVPTDLTSGTELEVIKETLEKVKPEAPQLHPMALDLNNKLSDPEFKLEDWIKEVNSVQNLLSLSGKEFMKQALPLDYPDATPEDIDQIIEDLDRAGSLKLQELNLKKQIKSQKQQQEQEYTERIQRENEQRIEQANMQVQEELNQVFENSKKLNDIWGIPISEAERNAFNKTFAELAKRDKTGRMPLMDLLQSNDDVYKFAYLVLNGNTKFKEALFNAKEGTKDEVFKKLRSTPTSGPGTATGTPTGSSKPDYKNLTIPQQY